MFFFFKLFLFLISCFSKCGPRLSDEGAEKLKNQYVLMRSGTVTFERDTGKRMSIPITVRFVLKSKKKLLTLNEFEFQTIGSSCPYFGIIV